MAPSSKRNETKLASSTNVLAKAEHKNLVNEAAIFHLRKLLANVDGLPASLPQWF